MPLDYAQLVARQEMPDCPGWVMPAYDGQCTVNLVNSLLAYLGAPAENRLAFHDELAGLLGGRRKILLVVLDGLGWGNLDDAAARRPRIRQALAGARRIPLTTVFPSTTAAALCSFTTGVMPAQHGVIGFLMYFPAYRRVFNMLSFQTYDAPNEKLLDFGFKPLDYLRHPTIFARLGAAGVQAASYTFQPYVDSGLSHLLYADTMPYPYLALGDMQALAAEQLRAPFSQLILAYWSTLDSLGHLYGGRSTAYINELELLATFIAEQLRPSLDDDIALLVTADHGHLDGDDGTSINLSEMTGLAAVLRAPPAGEGRAMHLFIRPGEAARAGALLAGLPEATVFSKAAFLDRRFLGNVPIRAGLEEHIGDFIVLPHGSRRLLFEYKPRPHTAMAGRHGGLTPVEMVVPLLVF